MDPNRLSNPYQPPAITNSQRVSRHDGLFFLLSGVLVSIASTLLVAYLMIVVVPEIKSSFHARNEKLDPVFSGTVRIADFFCKYWFAWLFLVLALIVTNEFLSKRNRKCRVRTTCGVVLFLFAISAAFWMLWLTLVRY